MKRTKKRVWTVDKIRDLHFQNKSKIQNWFRSAVPLCSITRGRTGNKSKQGLVMQRATNAQNEKRNCFWTVQCFAITINCCSRNFGLLWKGAAERQREGDPDQKRCWVRVGETAGLTDARLWEEKKKERPRQTFRHLTDIQARESVSDSKLREG